MIIFHALAELILLLLFIFRLSRAFCWFYDWFFRVLGGDGSAIDCHLESASSGAFHPPMMSSHVEIVPWCNFFSLLEDGEIFRQMFFGFPNRHVMQQRSTHGQKRRRARKWSGSESRSSNPFSMDPWKCLKDFLSSSLSAELSIFFFHPHPTDSVKFENISSSFVTLKL